MEISSSPWCVPLGHRASADFPPARKCVAVPGLSSLLVASLPLPTLTLYPCGALPCSWGLHPSSRLQTCFPCPASCRPPRDRPAPALHLVYARRPVGERGGRPARAASTASRPSQPSRPLPAPNSPPRARPGLPRHPRGRVSGLVAPVPSPQALGAAGGAGRTSSLPAGPGTVGAVEGPAGSHLTAVPEERDPHRARHRTAHGAAVPMATAGGRGRGMPRPPYGGTLIPGRGGGAVRFPGGGGGFSGLSPGTGSALGVFPRRFPHAAAASSEPPVVGGCLSPPTPPRRALWGGRARPPPSCAAAGGEGARGAAAGAQPCPAPVWKAGDAGLSSSFHLSSGLGGVWFLTALAGVVLCDAFQLPGTLA